MKQSKILSVELNKSKVVNVLRKIFPKTPVLCKLLKFIAQCTN